MSLVNVIDGFFVGGHHYHPTFNEELGCQRQLFGKKTRNDKWHSCSHKHLASPSAAWLISGHRAIYKERWQIRSLTLFLCDFSSSRLTKVRISKSTASAGCFSPPLPFISTVFRFSRMIGFRSVQYSFTCCVRWSVQFNKEKKKKKISKEEGPF